MTSLGTLRGTGQLVFDGEPVDVSYAITLRDVDGRSEAEGVLAGPVRVFVSALGSGPAILTLAGGGRLRIEVIGIGPAAGRARIRVLDAVAD